MKSKLKVFLSVSVIVLLIDQLTKLAAYQLLVLGESSSYLWDTLRIGLIFNHGVFLGLGNDMDPNIRFAIFTLLVPLILAGFIYYVFKSDDFKGSSFVAVSAVIAGGFANVLDRLYNNGGVIDFINMGLGGLRTGIFNVADMAVMFGVFFLLFKQIMESKKENKE